MKIAQNPTAAAYDKLQNSIDWSTANNAEQIKIMLVMKQLLTQAPGHTPIFDFGVQNLETGQRSVKNAAEQIDYITARIQRLEN